MGCWTLDAVPWDTFTPQEHLVELLRVLLERDAILALLEPQEKTFITLMLMREFSRTNKKILLILPQDKQIPLWKQFLQRMSNAQVLEQVVIQVALPEQQQDSYSLIIVDALQMSLGNEDFATKLSSLRGRNTRFCGITSHLLSPLSNPNPLKDIQKQMENLESFFGVPVECSCDVLTLLRYVSKPAEKIITFSSLETPEISDKAKEEKQVSIAQTVQKKIEDILQTLIIFLKNHQFSLLEIYGEDFQDLIDDIPNPAELPLKLVENFLNILRSCGIWCAERASLLLTIKIDKLKTREKYERHFLLLSLVYSEMMKIRKICDDAFADLTEKEKLIQFSKPKLLSLMNILLTYKPEHIQDNENSEENAVPYKKKKLGYNSYDDPNALCGVIFVKDKFMSKVLYHFLKQCSRSDTKFSFLAPNYAIKTDDDDMEEENSSRKQEEALRRFRMRECNILVSNSNLEVGIDVVRCNLIIAFDLPESFGTYASYKVKAKAAKSYFLSLCNEDELEGWKVKLNYFRDIESKLIQKCTYRDSSLDEKKTADLNNELISPWSPPILEKVEKTSEKSPKTSQEKTVSPSPKKSDISEKLENLDISESNEKSENKSVMNDVDTNEENSEKKELLNCEHSETNKKPEKPKPKLSLKNAILLLNRYCAKLPSDTFTRLTPINSVLKYNDEYVCIIQLPINCPLKEIIVGPCMPNQVLAKRAAAFTACRKLFDINELDNNMNPIGKDGGILKFINNANYNNENARPGTTKRRQYYYKKIAKCLKSIQVNDEKEKENFSKFKLYDVKLRLSCPIPDDQKHERSKNLSSGEFSARFRNNIDGNNPAHLSISDLHQERRSNGSNFVAGRRIAFKSRKNGFNFVVSQLYIFASFTTRKISHEILSL